MVSREQVLNANIKVHTQLADQYKATEPHYRPENIDRVRGKLLEVKGRTGGKELLDIGCGMGFIIDIAKDHFTKIRGIDITPAMLEKVNTASESCDIQVQVANSEKLPFEGSSFDVCTAYAMLHHLYEIESTLKEVYRVLKPGGIFYSDLDPNAYFWEAISALTPEKKYSDFVQREYAAVLLKPEEIEEKFHVSQEDFEAAEFLKHMEGGFKEEIIEEMCKRIGFSKFEFEYVWFLGEAKVIHDEKNKEAAPVLRNHLKEMLPLSRHLFKYVSFYAVK